MSTHRQTPPRRERVDSVLQLDDVKYEHEHEHDWTDDLPKTDHVRFFCETDWSQSQLGPLEDWSPSLRLFTRMVLADSRAACLWWGPNLVAIYNETYKPLSGKAHPKLMGDTFQAVFPDLWSQMKPYFDRARETGVGSDYSTSMPLMVERLGWREETFFQGSFVPIGSGPTNHPDGFYHSVFEVTLQRLAERRIAMLNRIASIEDLKAGPAWSHILATLETNPHDIPLAILYEAEDSSGTTTLHLRGSFGLPDGHSLLVDDTGIDSDEGLIPDCRRAGAHLLVTDCDDRFASVCWQGFGVPPDKIVIMPLTSCARILGYLIVGTNPYRPYDTEFDLFQHDLRRLVSSLMAAAVSADESKSRQQQLEEDLEFSDTKLRHLMEHASVGMAHLSLDGDIIWANERYYDLHGVAPYAPTGGKFAFFDMYADEDRPRADEAWESLIHGADQVTLELGTKGFYTSPLGDKTPAHINIMAFPYREHGEVKGIMTAITDISRFHWAENFQARLAAEAREAKRQQEAFIDVVSHEMRNPLGAIVHCADEISKSLEECKTRLSEIPEPCLSLLQDNVASANIIMQCANHQKRIIDDVLTLSKLDSMLLSITPSPVRPTNLIDSILGIFEGELKSTDIRYSISADESLHSLGIKELYLDPSRVTQIFINLVTNAIKFVKSTKEPKISIRYGATTSDPRAFFPSDMFWPPKSRDNSDVTGNPEWGTGEVVYLTFTVQDTGIGITKNDMHKIWERFRQANMRTHVKYGGSGLGLFISKELTEKQGGEIGVSSIPGQGSTFGFYIRTKRVEERPQSISLHDLHDLHDLPHTSHKEQHEHEQKQHLHVLLVEDNVINQQVLDRQLKKAGCVVDVANHGIEALSKLETQIFDVVLMDLEMPVMDGLTATKEIRKRQSEGRLVGNIPIIAVTANVRQEQMDTAFAAGADRVMQKPFKAVDLIYMMKGLVPQVTTPSSERPTPGLSGPLNGILI